MYNRNIASPKASQSAEEKLQAILETKKPNLLVMNAQNKAVTCDLKSNNKYQATILKISSLIREGNDRLQEHGEKGILLLGNTGAGKSTLAHLLCGRKLQAIMDDETNEMVIDAIQPLKDIVIGHNFASETKIPNKSIAKDVNIWDCPGFNDTDPVQEIANTFYIKRLFEITDQIKLALVIADSDIRSKRGSDFLEMLSNFMKYFKNFGTIVRCISLVVTQVPKDKNIRHIRKSIEKVLTDNQKTTEEHNRLVNMLKDSSIHLFFRPNVEGEIACPNLFRAIESYSDYSKAEGDMIDISISKEAEMCSSHLLNTVLSNFDQILEAMVKGISDATKCLSINPLNVFSEKYNLIKDWIPSSISYSDIVKQGDDCEYFSELDVLLKMLKVLVCEKVVNVPDAIAMFQQAMVIIAEYVDPNNNQLQHMIQDYNYCLQQQYEYMKFFSSVRGIELPNHTVIRELISTCHANITKSLEYQVSSLNIDGKMTDRVYYHKAIKYLELFPDSPACKKKQAFAYCRLADIVDQNSVKKVLSYSVKAIDADHRLPKMYEKLGLLFYKNNEYSKAIDCYKVVNNEFKIRKCFKAWLKQDEDNPDIMLKQAEYFNSIGLFEEAKKYYHHAFSLSEDDNFKGAALVKIGNIMANTAAKGQDFITRGNKRNFYNFDLVDKIFMNNLLSK